MLSVIRVKGGGGEGSPVPGRQDSAVGGRLGWGETEGGESGDRQVIDSQARAGFITRSDDGLPTAQGWARGRERRSETDEHRAKKE